MRQDLDLPVPLATGVMVIRSFSNKRFSGAVDKIGIDGCAVSSPRRQITKRLHALTDGDPLLVRAYVEDIWKTVDGGTDISVDDLDRLKPGYLGYFERWWEDQRRQWPGRRPERDVKLALALLAHALGPLRASELGALAEDYLEANEIDAAETLRLIRRFVTGDGLETGYSFQHPKFAEFFRESEALDSRLVERTAAAYRKWGSATLRGLDGGTLAPDKAPPIYLLRHLLAHLIAAQAPMEDLMAITQLPWLRARLALDGSDEGIAYDLTRIRDALVRRRAVGGPPYFDERYRIALFLSSIRSLSSRIPAELLLAALYAKVITPRKALHFARSEPGNKQRGSKLTMLVPHLLVDERLEVMGEALAAAQAIENEWARAEALTGLAPHLPADERFQVVGAALAAARAIGGDDARAHALAGLAPHLPADECSQVVGEALAAALAIGDEEWRARALTGVVPHLPVDERFQVVGAALAAAQAIENEWARAEALTGLAPHLSPEQRGEALAAAMATEYGWVRAEAMTGLAPHLSQEQQSAALAAARAIGGEGARAYALTGLAPHLLPEERADIVGEALTAAWAIRDEEQRALTLTDLAPHLSPEQLGEALAAARAIGNEGRRALILTALAPHLSPEQQSAGLAAARAIGGDDARAHALAGLAPHLPADECFQVMGEALAAAQAIRDEEARAEAFAELAPHLPADERFQVVGAALAAARAIGGDDARAHALAGLVPHLPADERSQVMGEALAAARAIYMLPEQQSEALAAVQVVGAGFVALAREIGNEGARAEALTGLASHLSPEQLVEALAAARAIGGDDARAYALTGLAPHLSPEQLVEALAAARAIGGDDVRAHALAGLAPHLPSEQREAAITDILATVEAKNRGDFLSHTKDVVTARLCDPGAMAAAIIDAQAMWP